MRLPVLLVDESAMVIILKSQIVWQLWVGSTISMEFSTVTTHYNSAIPLRSYHNLVSVGQPIPIVEGCNDQLPCYKSRLKPIWWHTMMVVSNTIHDFTLQVGFWGSTGLPENEPSGHSLETSWFQWYLQCKQGWLIWLSPSLNGWLLGCHIVPIGWGKKVIWLLDSLNQSWQVAEFQIDPILQIGGRHS